MIVSNHLYVDVIQHGFRDLRAEDFWTVQSSIPEKNFTAGAWMWVPDRRDGASPPAAAPAVPADVHGPPEEIVKARALLEEGKPRDALAVLEAAHPAGDAARAALLDVQADALIALGEHQRAVGVLEELLRLEPEPPPSALLRLGRSQLRVGDAEVALHTFTYLLDRAPMTPEAYLELGRFERESGRYATAMGYLAEGARLLDPGGNLGALITELTKLPVTDE